MDWVPLLFIDAVCHQLKYEALKQVGQLSGEWLVFGFEHEFKRREFGFSCDVDGKTGTYCIADNIKNTFPRLTAADLNIEFDRITSVALGTLDEGTLDTLDEGPMEQRTQGVPLDVLERDVFPRVASIVTNCLTWPGYKNPIFCNAFKNCPGFNNIIIKEHDEESHDFIARQVELESVRTLSFYARKSFEWPEPEKLAKTFKTFVNSDSFYQLTYSGSFSDLVELYALFLERALAGKLKPFSFILMNYTTDEEFHLMSILHPVLRERSMRIAWRIPISNCRVLLQRQDALLRIKVD